MKIKEMEKRWKLKIIEQVEIGKRDGKEMKIKDY